MSPSAAKPAKIKTKVKAEVVGRETQGVITARIGNEDAGHLAFVDYAGTVQIRMVYTEPEHRRKGVGRAMVAALREYLPASKPARFLLNADGKGFRDAVFDEYARPRG